MKNRQTRNLLVGIFVTIGIGIFIATIYLVGRKENIFGSPIKVSAIFSDVQGLREGDKVRLSGIDVGTVSRLAFQPDNQVFIEMNLDEESIIYVKEDSRVTIGSEGLMGSKVVEILPGTITANPISPFDTLQSIEMVALDDILTELNATSKNITLISGEIIEITQKINRGDGIFGKIFTDETLTGNLDDATANISRFTENLFEISEQVNNGQGIIGKLFTDTTLTRDLGTASESIDDIAQNLEEITEKINRGEGVFGRMFTDTTLTSNLFMTSKNLQETSNSLMDLAEKLNNDSSALNLLINDPTFADSLEVLIDRINVGVVEATEAADAVQRSGLIRMFSKKKDKEPKKE